MSLEVINKSVIMKALGLSVDADEIKSVVVPKEVIKQANEKMSSYRKVLKENRHASAKNKIKHILKREDNNTEKQRKKQLDTAMFTARKWMREAATYFENCGGANLLEKFSNEIEKDFNDLKSKDYLTTSLTTDAKDYEIFDVNKYKLDNSYEGNYLQNCRLSYLDLCQRFQVSLKSSDNKFKDKRKAAKEDLKKEKISIDLFREVKREIKEYCAIFDDSKEKFLDYAASIKDKLPKIEQKVLTIMGNIDMLTSKRDKILNSLVSSKKSVYYPTSDKAKINNPNQAFGGFVKGLNNIYRYLTFGYQQKGDFSKVVVKEFKDLRGMLSDELSQTIDEFTKANIDNSNANKRTELIEKITNKLEKQNEEIKKASKSVNKYKKMLDTQYKVWKLEERNKKIRTGFLVAFALLGVFTSLFNAFFPLLDAALAVEPVPFAPMPQ